MLTPSNDMGKSKDYQLRGGGNSNYGYYSRVTQKDPL